MRGCMVELIFRLVGIIFSAVIRFVSFLVMLMTVSVSSLFVGVDVAINRISTSWIEQSTGNGVMIGYSPVARDGAKVAASVMLVVGWLLDIGVICLIVSLFTK